jgi:hypothetical protein
MSSKKPTEFHKEYSSRIKKIYIQLHDYQYYHCPYEESQGDRRFIGRKSILEKLQSLFTNTEYSTGAYLITGYRGSGKTSMVNKVISEIENKKSFLKGSLIGYVLILFFYVLFSFIFLDWLNSIYNNPFASGYNIACILLMVIILFLGFITLILNKNKTLKKGLKWWQFKKRLLNILTRMFILKDLSFQERKYYTAYLPWYCLTLIPMVVCLTYFVLCNKEKSPYSYLGLLCGPYYFILIINIVYNLISAYKSYNISSVSDTLRSILNGFLKFRATIFIKLNLGHAKLRDVDILKLLARNLKTELIRYYRTKTVTRVMLSVVTFYFIYTLTYLIYYQPVVFQAHNVIKNASGFNLIFRSQDSVLLSQPSETNPYGQVNLLYKGYQDSITLLYHKSESYTSARIQHITTVELIWKKALAVVSIAITFLDAYLYLLYHYSRTILLN